MSGAARVFVTLDELAIMLELSPGHRLHAVETTSPEYIPGVLLTISSDDEAAGPRLPKCQPTQPLMAMDLVTYRKWDTSPAGRMVEERVRDVGSVRSLDSKTAVYTPAKSPVMRPHPAHPQGGDIRLTIPPPDDTEWPAFPGQGLPITGEPVQGDDPGDEHMGGPR